MTTQHSHPDMDFWHVRGQRALMLGRLEDAAVCFERAAAVAPEHLRAACLANAREARKDQAKADATGEP